MAKFSKIQLWRDWSGPRRRRHRPRYAILVIVLLLVTIGAIVQFTISPAQVAQKTFQTGLTPWGGDNSFFYRHLLAIGIGIGALLLGFQIHLRHWLRWSPYLLGLSLFLAGLAGFGGGRWLDFLGNSLQPVELVKFFLILVLAGLIIKAANHRKKSVAETLIANRASLGLLALVAFVIGGLQGDLGSLVVLLTVAAVMFLVSGVNWATIGTLAGAGLGGILALIIVAPYRLQRVITFFGDSANDCLAQGYHICQALIAIGSGGLWGRGLGRSVQVFGYLPETINDSIFAIYAEIAGFFGSLFLLGLFVCLFGLIYKQARRLEDPLFLIMGGILVWLAVQSAINIGSMLDLLPMKGITLPYISFGGSSLVMVLLASGFLLQLSSYSRYDDADRDRPSWWRRWWRWWSLYQSDKDKPQR